MTLHLPIIPQPRKQLHIAASTKGSDRTQKAPPMAKYDHHYGDHGRNAGWLQAPLHFLQIRRLRRTRPYLPSGGSLTLRNSCKKAKDLLKKKSPLSLYPKGIKLVDDFRVCESACRRLQGRIWNTSSCRELPPIWRISCGRVRLQNLCRVELSTLQRSASHMASRVDIDEAMMVEWVQP